MNLYGDIWMIVASLASNETCWNLHNVSKSMRKIVQQVLIRRYTSDTRLCTKQFNCLQEASSVVPGDKYILEYSDTRINLLSVLCSRLWRGPGLIVTEASDFLEVCDLVTTLKLRSAFIRNDRWKNFSVKLTQVKWTEMEVVVVPKLNIKYIDPYIDYFNTLIYGESLDKSKALNALHSPYIRSIMLKYVPSVSSTCNGKLQVYQVIRKPTDFTTNAYIEGIKQVNGDYCIIGSDNVHYPIMTGEAIDPNVYESIRSCIDKSQPEVFEHYVRSQVPINLKSRLQELLKYDRILVIHEKFSNSERSMAEFKQWNSNIACETLVEKDYALRSYGYRKYKNTTSKQRQKSIDWFREKNNQKKVLFTCTDIIKLGVDLSVADAILFVGSMPETVVAKSIAKIITSNKPVMIHWVRCDVATTVVNMQLLKDEVSGLEVCDEILEIDDRK